MVKTKLVRIRCNNCNNEQIIYYKPSNIIHCLNCNNIVARPSGGKLKLEGAKIIEVVL